MTLELVVQRPADKQDDGCDAPRPHGRRNPTPSVPAVRWQERGSVHRDETVPNECAISLIYNGASYAVLMASPCDVDELGLGFSIAEAVVESADEVAGVEVQDVALGLEVSIDIPPARAEALIERQRSMLAGTSCGLCGIISIERALRPLPRNESKLSVSPEAINSAISSLPSLQVLNQATGAVHGAAFAHRDGDIVMLREDVGRHNALDKLIGALSKAEIDPRSGFVVLTSRCSMEMVQKAATAGFSIVVAISAPTALAIDLATDANITLAAFARRGAFNVYANPERIRSP